MIDYKISDVLIIGKEIGKNQVVSVPQILSENWGLHAYLYRFFYLSIEVGGHRRLSPKQVQIEKISEVSCTFTTCHSKEH